MNFKSAVTAIQKHGILLVYPLDNRSEPRSLWSCFYPRSEMRWEWDQEGDTRVADLWHLRTKLSESRKVVYAKWFRGRATFFSKEVFTALLALLQTSRAPNEGLGAESRRILDALNMDSPLSTKQLKALTELRGRALEPLYEKALKQLWSRLLIVGCGEFDDGAFPSLAIGSTSLLHEDLWDASKAISPEEASDFLAKKIPQDSPFLKQLTRLKKAG
jgi:hypothetical protein